ncbi:MAG: hypothetical protein RLZZ622_1815, partial [Planctomycetota bacterium]
MSGFKKEVSLSLRFGLQSTGFFFLVRVKPHHQNVQQDGASSGAHWWHLAAGWQSGWARRG